MGRKKLIKLGIACTTLCILLIILYPLVVFIYESIQNPELVKISIAFVSIENQSAILRVTLEYQGSVPLKDVRAKIAEEEVYFGDVTRGTYVRNVSVPIDKIERFQDYSVEVRAFISGIYPINVHMKL